MDFPGFFGYPQNLKLIFLRVFKNPQKKHIQKSPQITSEFEARKGMDSLRLRMKFLRIIEVITNTDWDFSRLTLEKR